MKTERMKKFEPIDITTADVAFIAHGKSPNEVFENSALAMSEVMVNTKQVKPKKSIKFELDGTDINSLMFNFLNKLLFYVDAESMVFSKFKVNVDISKLKLTAICSGEKVSDKIETRTEVKAATYHEMKIWKSVVSGKTYWNSKIILDI